MNKAVVFLAIVAVVLCGSAQARSNTILDIAAATPELSALASVVSRPEFKAIAEALSNPSASLTLFAPSNAAFAKAKLPSDPAAIADVLLYHVLPERVASTDLVNGLQFPATLLTDDKLVNLGKGKAQVVAIAKSWYGIVGVGNAIVNKANIKASNGIIHIIDNVLEIPEKTSATAAKSPVLGELVKAVVKANLVQAVDTTPQLTIFAPVDAAFEANAPVLKNYDLKDVLLFHVVPGVYYPSDLKNGTVLKTLLGEELSFIVREDSFFGTHIDIIGGKTRVNWIEQSVATANGVVNLINGVFLPSKKAADKRRFF